MQTGMPWWHYKNGNHKKSQDDFWRKTGWKMGSRETNATSMDDVEEDLEQVGVKRRREEAKNK